MGWEAWVEDEQGRKRLRDAILLDELRDGTARPSVVLRGLDALGRSLAVAHRTVHMYKLPPLRRCQERVLARQSESYDLALDLALEYVEEVREHCSPPWVADAMEARYVDGGSCVRVAAALGVSPNHVAVSCDRALKWLDGRHGFTCEAGKRAEKPVRRPRRPADGHAS